MSGSKESTKRPKNYFTRLRSGRERAARKSFVVAAAKQAKENFYPPEERQDRSRGTLGYMEGVSSTLALRKRERDSTACALSSPSADGQPSTWKHS